MRDEDRQGQTETVTGTYKHKSRETEIGEVDRLRDRERKAEVERLVRG